MKNNLKYYYNIDINDIYNKDNYYYFYINNILYNLIIYDNDINIDKELYNINIDMIKYNLDIHKIIINKFNNIITNINNKLYILLEINNNNNILNLNKITSSNIFKFNYNYLLIKDSWDILWSKRIDYLAYQLNQMGHKYPLLVESFSYYEGLTENAISYIKNTLNTCTKDNSDIIVLSHNKLYSYNDYLDPLNIIFDHKSRDIAEYIKYSFFNNINIVKELDSYLKHNYLSEFSIRLIYGRLLYPNYYLDIFDKIILNKANSKDLFSIINKISKYEIFLLEIYNLFSKYYNIPKIDWLK